MPYQDFAGRVQLLQMIDTNQILQTYYDPESRLYNVLVEHSRYVADKALRIARKYPELNPDLVFIEEASLLHDIGIIKTRSDSIGCNGEYPYVYHGFLGHEMLGAHGLHRHGLVAERHTGTGFSREDIIQNNLGLPERDMIPESLEEQIICYADKFFSKNPGALGREKSVDEVIGLLSRFSEAHVETFIGWAERFGD